MVDLKKDQVKESFRPAVLLSFSDGWEKPTAKEVRDLVSVAGLTGSQAGALVGVNGRTVRKWTGGEAAMPYAAWRLMCEYVGLLNPIVKK